jgi:PAS domain S-box-containing protein
MKDKNGHFTLINKEFERYFNIAKQDVLGRTDYDLMPKELADKYKETDQTILRSGRSMEIEETALLEDGMHTAISIKVPLYDDADNICGLCGISTDITARKKAEETLKKSHEILEKKVKERTSDLEEMNTALKVLLKKRDEDKKAMEAKIIFNYKTLVSPFFQKLKNSLTNKEQQRFMVILESNLQKFLEPFSQKLSNPMVNLTPREIQIASMIRQGLSNKEIAQILNNSYRTITSHRNNIRKKLGLSNKKVNLRSYLSSL